jgi:replicative DNA helicase
MNQVLPAAVVNIETEQALLGACLMNAEVLDLIEGVVSAEDFSEPVHVQIFEAFTRARTEGRRIDVGLVKAVLGADANVRLVDGMTTGQYIALLATDMATVINAPDYARIVAETANYRRLIAAGNALRDRAGQGFVAGSPEDIANEFLSDLDAIVSSGPKQSTRAMLGDAVSLARAAAEERHLHGVEIGLSWGLADLDAVTKLHPGDMTILAARPSMGKTTVGLSTCLHAAKHGDGVLFFSLEMGKQQVGQRAIADLCFDGWRQPISYADIRDGRLPEDGVERLIEAEEKLSSYPLLIEDQAGLTVSQIVARAKTGKKLLEKRGHQLGLICIDHLGLIAASDRYAGSRHLELGAMTSSIRQMAKDMQVPVLLLCQLSRGVEGRDNKRPMLSDLRESGRIEEDADAVILLYREAYYLERAKETDPDKDMARIERLQFTRNLLEINVAKQRQGATRTVEVFASMPHNAVRNAARSM